jgi:spermidine/putrescine transport system substrate-binding protein
MRPRPSSQVSRRTLLRMSALGLGGTGLLAACGVPPAKQSAESCVSTDLSSSQKSLRFSNWPSYMDEGEEEVNGQTVLPTLNAFEKKTGIKVSYTADINDNAEFYSKVRDQLGACQPTGRDIMVLTDWMASRMIQLGWIQELDETTIPNVHANILPSLKAPDWDKTRSYSVPWQTGLTGIAYNAKFTSEVRSFEEMLTRPELKGKVTLLSEMRDTMGFMLLMVGADPEEFNSTEWGRAVEKLQGFVASGQIRRFTGNDYIQELNSGNIAACEAWSGDVLSLQADNPDIHFVTPEEGLSLWSDNMLVPNKATHKAHAEALMNYYYDPVVAATLAAWVNFICPVQGAREAMKEIDPELVDNPLIFPDEAMLADAFGFMSVDEVTSRTYEADFNQVIGG